MERYERGDKVRVPRDSDEAAYVRSLDEFAFDIKRDKFSFYWSTQGSGLNFSTQMPAKWERHYMIDEGR
jgi:hypothetical protein